jgi:hypothetical protein
LALKSSSSRARSKGAAATVPPQDWRRATSRLWLSLSPGSGTTTIGVAGGKALPDQGLVEGGAISRGQREQPHTHAPGWKGLLPHEIPGQGGKTHGDFGGGGGDPLQQGDHAAGPGMHPVAGRHKMGPEIEASATGPPGGPAAHGFVAVLPPGRWPPPNRKAQGEEGERPRQGAGAWRRAESQTATEDNHDRGALIRL